MQEKEKLEGGEERSESEKSEDENADSLKENEQKINDAETDDATEEKTPAENEKGNSLRCVYGQKDKLLSSPSLNN